MKSAWTNRARRDALPRAPHLLGGDVDSRQVRPLRENACGPDAGPGPELEHVGPVGQQREQLLEALEPARSGDPPLPGRKGVGTGVVAAGDDVLWAFSLK